MSLIEDSLFSIQLGRLVGAAVTILLTTLEDGVWLVPLVLKASSFTIAGIHAVTFVVTFTLLSLSIGLVTTFAMEQAAADNLQDQGVLFSAAGAALCWLIAGILYLRAWMKRRRRQREQAERRRLSEAETAALFAPVDSSRQIDTHEEPLAVYRSVESGDNDNGDADQPGQEDEHRLQICLVISLTVVGAIDEVSYFPALIVGDVFSVAELTLGTILASLSILLIVCVALAPCGPVLDFLDSIPLYVVVFVFAILLTVQSIWEYAGEWDGENV